MTVRLAPARSEHFDWLIAGTAADGPGGLRLAVPELEPRDFLVVLRDSAEQLDATLGTSTWLILDENELVGLCSIKHAPDAEGRVEIGYGIATNRRGKGIASRAIALMLAEMEHMPAIAGVLAETVLDNLASQRVLQHNGFSAIGQRHDAEEGDLIIWHRPPDRGAT